MRVTRREVNGRGSTTEVVDIRKDSPLAQLIRAGAVQVTTTDRHGIRITWTSHDKP